jgi:hypothetical protein
LPSSENLFSSLSYAVFVAPAAVVLAWVVWRVMVLCQFYASRVAGWLGRLPAILRVPVAIGLLAVAWPILLLALAAWIGIRVFPGLRLEQGRVPRLFARTESRALSWVFVFCLVLPLIFVPLRYLADRVEGPGISLWHWLLVAGPLPPLVIWFIAFLRRRA